MNRWAVLFVLAMPVMAAPSNAEDAPAPRFPFDAKAARSYQKAFAESSGLPLEITNGLGMKFVLIPPGSFVMGSPAEEVGHNGGGFDETQHTVTLTKPFYLSKHETTVGQFRRFVESQKYVTDGETNGGGHAHDSHAVWEHRPGTSWLKPGFAGAFTLRDDHPVVHVSHADSIAFCRWLAVHSPPCDFKGITNCPPRPNGNGPAEPEATSDIGGDQTRTRRAKSQTSATARSR